MDSDMDEILTLLPAFMDNPADEVQERLYFDCLRRDFPAVDILESLKTFLAWILDNPDRYDRTDPSFHRRFRKWCERASQPATDSRGIPVSLSHFQTQREAG